MLVIAEMLAHLDLETGLQDLLGQLLQQPARPGRLHALIGSSLGQLAHQLRIHRRLHSSRLLRLLRWLFGCTHQRSLPGPARPGRGLQAPQLHRELDTPGWNSRNGHVAGRFPLLATRTAVACFWLSRFATTDGWCTSRSRP